ncbi:MAG: FemAB family PEP-CTERM system-associated protein [Planctomycetes bacterium]|nr:FemAB family PEP-CTERM system-associated protein [Planctomycetota bacterium]
MTGTPIADPSLVGLPANVPAQGESSPPVVSASAATLSIRALDAADDAAVEAWVRTSPSASFFHRVGWRRAVERAFGHETRDLVAWSEGRVVGVLPLSRCPGIFGASLISSPYAVYGGPSGASREIEHALVRAAQRTADQERVKRLELRCFDDLGLDLPASDLYATFIQELPDSPEKVLASIPKKARAEARKARERHGLTLAEGRWYVADLHQLFLNNKRKLGSPGLPRRWFDELLETFGDDCVVHMVHKDQRPLMAVMSFVWRDTLLAYYAGTADGADREFSASNFMYMALREWAVARGLRRFDFGRSRKDAGAFSFKEHQGFTPRDLHYRYHLVRDRELPSFTPSNPKTKVLRDAWSKLPPWVNARLSDALARYLP